MQPGLGTSLQQQQQFMSQRETDALRRQQMQAAIEAQKAKTAQLRDPRSAQANLPAAIQTAQYYSGLNPDERRLFRESRGGAVSDALARKGLQYDPTTGAIAPISDFGTGLGTIEADRLRTMSPAAAAAEAQKIAAKEGEKVLTEKRAALRERKATLPELEETVKELSALGKQATYTMTGQARDALMREAGMEPTVGAQARTAYTAMVDNQILPLLRQTFGPQFTVEEGNRLRETLGDPNKSPKEKDFVLDAFIRQKKKDITSLERELGEERKEVQREIKDDSDVISYEEFIQ